MRQAKSPRRECEISMRIACIVFIIIQTREQAQQNENISETYSSPIRRSTGPLICSARSVRLDDLREGGVCGGAVGVVRDTKHVEPHLTAASYLWPKAAGRVERGEGGRWEGEAKASKPR